MPHSVLLVDDEKNILLTLSQALQLAGYHTELAGTGKLGLDVALARPVDAVLMDVKMPDMDGLAVAGAAPPAASRAARHHDVRTRDHRHRGEGHAARSARLPGEAHRRGTGCWSRSATRSSTGGGGGAESLREESGRYEMVGQGPAMQRLYHLIQRAAPSEGRVLVTGENGTGKELVARALHRTSRRERRALRRSSTARRCRTSSSRASCSATRRAPSPARSRARRGKFELAARRHPVPRRDRRHAAHHAGEAPARAAGGRSSSGWAAPRP